MSTSDATKNFQKKLTLINKKNGQRNYSAHKDLSKRGAKKIRKPIDISKYPDWDTENKVKKYRKSTGIVPFLESIIKNQIQLTIGYVPPSKKGEQKKNIPDIQSIIEIVYDQDEKDDDISSCVSDVDCLLDLIKYSNYIQNSNIAMVSEKLMTIFNEIFFPIQQGIGAKSGVINRFRSALNDRTDLNNKLYQDIMKVSREDVEYTKKKNKPASTTTKYTHVNIIRV